MPRAAQFPLALAFVICSNTRVSDHLSLPPAERCAQVLAGLRRDMWVYAAWRTLIGPLLPWLHHRISRAAGRIQTLAARLAAGTLHRRAGSPRQAQPRQAQPRQAQPRQDSPRAQPPTAAEAPPPCPPRPPIPAGFGWLLRRVQTIEVIRLQVTGCRGRLEHLLRQPDMQDLLRAAPQIGRELRPICRMLGIEVPPGLFPPSRRRPAQSGAAPPAAARPARPKPPGPRTPRSRLRTMADYGPPSRPGWERPVRLVLPPPFPGKPPKSA